MKESLLQGYLFAYTFWLNLSLGCLGLLLLQHLLKARWGLAVLRTLEAGALTIPVMAIAFLPVVLGMHELYPWAHAGAAEHDPILALKRPYLNEPFFLARSFGYFVVWSVLAIVLVRWSAQQDTSGDPRLADKRANLSAPGMVVFVLSVTFAFTDWIMSLDPHWFSTIFGVWFVAGQALMTTAFAIVVLLLRRRTAPFDGVVNEGLLRDLGNLLLAFTMFWAYITLSQYLIIWSGNLPEEITYYLNRTQPGWDLMGAGLVVGQFFLPFVALLSSRTKRTPALLMAVALWTLAMRVIDIYWNVVPAFHNQSAHSALADLLCLALMGAAWLTAFVLLHGKRGVLPAYDARLREAAHHA